MSSHRIDHAPFSRPDQSRKRYEIIPVFPGWEQTRPVPIGYHRHLFYELLWLTAGTTLQTVDFVDHTLTAGQLLFMPRHIVHHCCEGQAATGVLLLFETDYFSVEQMAVLRHFRLLSPLTGAQVLTPDAPTQRTLQCLFDLLQTDTTEPISTPHNLAAQSLLYVLLYHVERLLGPQDVPSQTNPIANSATYHQFSDVLETHFRTEHDVGFYASALALSRKQLARSVADMSGGYTTQQLIHNRLIHEAKRLLVYSGKSVKEIAFSLGFDDPAYFSRLFRQKAGQSPDAFRASWALSSC